MQRLIVVMIAAAAMTLMLARTGSLRARECDDAFST
jgi:hypothetical protein